MKTAFAVVSALLGLSASVLANDTVPRPNKEQLDKCNANQYRYKGDPKCCAYDDCVKGIFYQRCCYKYDGKPETLGRCKYGINSYPQGTCY